MRIILQRTGMSLDGTFGMISTGGGNPLCLTLEDPWLENQRNKSCIPAGVYTFSPHHGAKYQNVWRADHVPGRSGILIHAGNTTADTEGCILVGLELGAVGGKDAILQSKKALDYLRAVLPAKFILEVRDA